MRFLLIFYLILHPLVFRAQGAASILNFNLKMRGGQDVLLKLRSYKMEGVLVTKDGEFPASITFKDKIGYRFDYDSKLFKNYILITPTNGYRFSPEEGKSTLIAMDYQEYTAQKHKLNVSFDVDNLVNKDYVIDYVGDQDCDGNICDAISLRYHTMMFPIMIYVSKPPSHQIVKESYTVMVNGQETQHDERFSDFQTTTEGYVFPMRIRSDLGEFKVKKIRINPMLEDFVFVPSQHVIKSTQKLKN